VIPTASGKEQRRGQQATHCARRHPGRFLEISRDRGTGKKEDITEEKFKG